MKNIVVAGTESGVGKTTIALGLMASLTQKGYKVQPFKVGPDYIDPGFHSLATGVKSRNLDSYFLEDEGVKRVFIKGSKKADISIIEGVMGLFDGKGEEGRSSTAEIARILDAPVVLVMDVGKVAQSAAAVAYGYKNYDPDLKVQAIILNNIASQGHYQMIKKAIEEKVGIKVIGCLYKNTELKLSERHLGLVPTFESNDIEKYFNKLRKEIDDNIDIKLLLNIMNDNNLLIKQEKIVSEISTKRNVNIGIAYDQAFNFYYQENLDILKERGANLIYFSPVNDTSLPDVDGIYIGGGFPESFLRELAENREMKNDIYTKIKLGLPVYAECGGLMYLARDVVDFNKEEYSMVGIIPGRVLMEDKLQAMGYVRVKSVQDNVLFRKGQQAKGHEFHYSRLVDLEKENYSYRLIKSKSLEERAAGYQYKSLLASYIHLHFASNPLLVDNFLNKCLIYRTG